MIFRGAVFVLFLNLLLCVGCAQQKNISPIPSINPETQRRLDRPVDCTNPQRDIKILEDERASIAAQTVAGVRAVLPIAAVAGLLTGDYSSRIKVATGQYNADIETKINDIKAVCGIS